MNKTKPPKNREFLGLVEDGSHIYWDILFWATREHGVNGKSCYTDRMLYEVLPQKIKGWVELPMIEEYK
jgi:hypothetical protein